MGDAFALDVHVVSDLRHALRGGITSARLHWPGGEHSWRWQGDVGADTCVRVGAVNLLVPSPAHPAAKAHAQASLAANAASQAVEVLTVDKTPVDKTLVDQPLIGFNPDPVTEIFLDLTFEHPEATATNRYRARFV